MSLYLKRNAWQTTFIYPFKKCYNRILWFVAAKVAIATLLYDQLLAAVEKFAFCSGYENTKAKISRKIDELAHFLPVKVGQALISSIRGH